MNTSGIQFVQLLKLTWRHFKRVEGETIAAAFAYYGFFSLFPLILMLIAGTSFFLGSESSSTEIVVRYMEHLFPLDENGRSKISQAIGEVTKSRGNITLIAALVLLWGSLRFFTAPIRGMNHIWEGREFQWWSLPLKNLSVIGILCSIFAAGILLPLGLESAEQFASYFPLLQLPASVLKWARIFLGPGTQFLGLLLFYKFAPRRRIFWADVWPPAMVVTAFSQLLQWASVLYIYRLGNFGKLYGPFAIVIVILMWIYFTGILLLLGGCLSRALRDLAQVRQPEKESVHSVSASQDP